MDFDTLAQWAQQLKKHKTVAWSQLPDIDLYMDQVITYLERQTALLRAQDQDKMMTPSMINNYAKNGILPRPQGKKYSREHLALLMAISMIKPIISMEEIERLLRFYRTKENVDGMFSQFCKTQDEVLLEQTDRFERSLQACTEAEDCEACLLYTSDYCDGLGDCLPACPTGAITFVEREAAAYDAAAVQAAQAGCQAEPLPCGCPGTQSRALKPDAAIQTEPAARAHAASRLGQWPVQIKLAPVNAPYFKDAKLLIAADCTAYAYGNFHEDFIAGRVTLIGCPKLDSVDYAEKLTEILRHNDIKSVTVVRKMCRRDRR